MQKDEEEKIKKLKEEDEKFLETIERISKTSLKLNCFPDPAESCYNKGNL